MARLRMLVFIPSMLLAVCMSSTGAAAQSHVTIGTGSAPGHWDYLPGDPASPSFGGGWIQTFVAPRNAIALTSFAFLAEGAWESFFPGYFCFFSGPFETCTPGSVEYLDLATLPIHGGDIWEFYIEVNSCLGWGTCGLVGDETCYEYNPYDHCGFDPQTFYDFQPRLWVTDGDAYADGGLTRYPGGPLAGQDMAFSATFQTTPEPATLALLGTGLVGLGALARRRRRE